MWFKKYKSVTTFYRFTECIILKMIIIFFDKNEGTSHVIIINM